MAWFKKKQDPISERARDLKKQIADLEGQIRKLSAQQSKAPSLSSPADHAATSSAPPSDHPFRPTASGVTQSNSQPAIRPFPPSPVKSRPPSRSESSSSAPSPPPKLRSTARPQSPTVFLPKTEPGIEPASPMAEDPIFEEVSQNPFRVSGDAPVAEAKNHLDIRRNDWFSIWRRIKSNFRGPATSNPKLVNYLAAGSIQGLRPLRYERRVARNRFLVLVVLLIVVLWGIVALIFFR